MNALSTEYAVHVRGAIVDAVLSSRDAPAADRDFRAFVFTPNDPATITRRVVGRGADARWEQDVPTFAKVARVANWGWLRRVASGYAEPNLVNSCAGLAFDVTSRRYKSASSGAGYMSVQRFDPIIIARLSDGRYFADQWSDPSVLYDSLSRWRNARGYTCHWDSPIESITCAIGGRDWATIPDMIAEHRRRVARERDAANPAFQNVNRDGVEMSS